MQNGIARVLLVPLGAGLLAACAGGAQPALAPAQKTATSEADAPAEQQELDRRRLQLQEQLLGELRKLRESRQASTAGAEAAESERPESADGSKLLIFGGVNHEVYLGCLCEEQDTDSVFNRTGEFGSDLSVTSLRNKFSPYGSNYDDTSSCNATARRPPKVVTSDGKSLGLLTVNHSLPKRISAPSLSGWLERMCGE